MNDVQGTVGGLTASDVSERDVAAVAAMNTYRTQQLARIQGRAEKWIAGMAAVVGVLTTAVVIKGPESFSKLPQIAQATVIALMLSGGVAVAYGVWQSYRAAHGDPLSEGAVEVLAGQQATRDNASIAGAATEWDTAVSTSYQAAKIALGRSALGTIAGVFLLSAAVLVTWLVAPEQAAGATVCIRSGANVTALTGDLPQVESGELVIVSCD